MNFMNSLTDSELFQGKATSLDARRKRTRKSSPGESLVTILEGPLSGQQFTTAVRDPADDHTSFLARTEITIGQRVQIELGCDGGKSPVVERADVVRCRMLSTGRYEVAVEIRRATPEPKMSESQRRHERRRLTLGK